MINNNINKNSLRELERETVTRGKTAREKRQIKKKKTNGYTKETVSPVSKKQELSPSEQSLWNKDSLQTFVHNQSKSIQRLNCLDAVGFSTTTLEETVVRDLFFEITILFFKKKKKSVSTS